MDIIYPSGSSISIESLKKSVQLWPAEDKTFSNTILLALIDRIEELEKENNDFRQKAVYYPAGYEGENTSDD